MENQTSENPNSIARRVIKLNRAGITFQNTTGPSYGLIWTDRARNLRSLQPFEDMVQAVSAAEKYLAMIELAA